mmetsp:Transcript_7088/g.14636  ORF Transcript_7088/g.14636 Transcript_7088/m.14636 type:complete len:86 (+) Transcript_7088:390-647(+)
MSPATKLTNWWQIGVLGLSRTKSVMSQIRRRVGLFNRLNTVNCQSELVHIVDARPGRLEDRGGLGNKLRDRGVPTEGAVMKWKMF